MKVFKFYAEGYHYALAAETEEKALEAFDDQVGGSFDSVEEIPESKWDDKFINIWEDNDQSTEPFKISIRDAICGEEPHMIFTNDNGLF